MSSWLCFYFLLLCITHVARPQNLWSPQDPLTNFLQSWPPFVMTNAEAFNGSTLVDLIGNGRHTTITGTTSTGSVSDDVNLKWISFVGGSTSTKGAMAGRFMATYVYHVRYFEISSGLTEGSHHTIVYDKYVFYALFRPG